MTKADEMKQLHYMARDFYCFLVGVVLVAGVCVLRKFGL